MYQNVLTNHKITKDQIELLYKQKLNLIGDAILIKHRFGITRKIDRFKFIRLKNLLAFIKEPILTIPINTLYSVLNNK